MQYLSAKMLYHPLAVLLFLASSVFRIAGACSSRSTPKPRPPSQSTRPNITFPTFECPKEYQTHYCLNNARCFTVKIENSVLYNCECTDGFTGPRCEFKDPDGSYLLNREKVMIETASIAGGVVVAILLIFIISIAIYVYVSRRRRKILSKSSETSRNETDTDRWSPFRARRSNPQSSDIQLERYPRPRDEESGEMSTCAELNASGSSSTHLSHQLQLLDPWIKMGSVDKR